MNMDVILSTERVDLQECEVLVTGFFLDERPLKGSSGLVDWRLNGRLSRLIIEERLTGEWKEKILIPSERRMVPRMILLLGLGRVKEYSYLRLRELSPFLLETLEKLNISSACFSLPYGDHTSVDCARLAEILIEGMADSFDLGKSDETWVRGLRLYFAEGERQMFEILLGAQTAKSMLEDKLQIRIFAPPGTISGAVSAKED
jgi:hypothetical protein